MVDSKDKPDDQIDRASKLRNRIEASNVRFKSQTEALIEAAIEVFIKNGFDKSTDFLAPKNAASTVTKAEWQRIKDVVAAGFSEEKQRVLNANIDTLSESDRLLRDWTKKEIRSKIKDFKKSMIRREAEGRGVQERRSPDQRVCADIKTTREKLQRAIDSGKDINFDAEKVIGWMELIEKETCPHTR